MDPVVTREQLAHSGMCEEIEQLCVNIGSEGCVKRETNVNFCTNMTCQKCPNVTSTRDLMPVTTKNVPSCTLILRARSKTVHGKCMCNVHTLLPGPLIIVCNTSLIYSALL